jgi:uncharacterized damage-inducible protein DinB
MENDSIRLSTSVGSAFIARASMYLESEYLPKIEGCLEQLDDNQIWWRPNPQSNSIGNLVLHLCGNARQWIVAGLGGSDDLRNRDAEFAQTEVIDRAELTSLLRSTIAEVVATLEALEPNRLLEKRQIQGSEVDVLQAVFHVTEHFSMHTGQIILLTKVLVNKDLAFYDFSTGKPVHKWQRPSP